MKFLAGEKTCRRKRNFQRFSRERGNIISVEYCRSKMIGSRTFSNAKIIALYVKFAPNRLEIISKRSVRGGGGGHYENIGIRT